MKKTYIRPAAAQVALATEGQLLAASGEKYNIDTTGTETTDQVFSGRRETFGPDSPWNSSNDN